MHEDITLNKYILYRYPFLKKEDIEGIIKKYYSIHSNKKVSLSIDEFINSLSFIKTSNKPQQ